MQSKADAGTEAMTLLWVRVRLGAENGPRAAPEEGPCPSERTLKAMKNDELWPYPRKIPLRPQALIFLLCAGQTDISMLYHYDLNHTEFNEVNNKKKVKLLRLLRFQNPDLVFDLLRISFD